LYADSTVAVHFIAVVVIVDLHIFAICANLHIVVGVISTASIAPITYRNDTIVAVCKT